MLSLDPNALVKLKDKRLLLLEYIFNLQGAEPQRLDYKLAAKALNVSKRTIARYCGQLAALNFIAFVSDVDGKFLIQINNAFIS